MTVQDVITTARHELGTVEDPPNTNRVKYNTWYYGHEVSGPDYPWCCTFIAWLFKRDQSLCKKTALCADLLEWFEARSQIVKTPQPGDIVFFRYSTNKRRTNHVGLVIAVNGKNITTIEGNTSTSSQDNGGKVMRRNRTGNIVAYARPKYTGSGAEPIKSIDDIAYEVIDGKWGSGNDRRQRLTKAGYDYSAVQSRVNQILKKD